MPDDEAPARSYAPATVTWSGSGPATVTWSGNGPVVNYTSATLTDSAGTIHVYDVPGAGWTMIVPGARRRLERERAEAEALCERARAREHERVARAAVAAERARAVLCSFLSATQRAELYQCEWFAVVGSAGGRYRIRSGTVSNVEWLNEHGHVGAELCCHPQLRHDGWETSLPLSDVMLAQMLHLQADEPGFLRTANADVGDSAFHVHYARVVEPPTVRARLRRGAERVLPRVRPQDRTLSTAVDDLGDNSATG